MATRTKSGSSVGRFKEFWRENSDKAREAEAIRNPLWEMLLGTFISMFSAWLFHAYVEPNRGAPDSGIAGDLFFGLIWACIRTGAWRRKRD